MEKRTVILVDRDDHPQGTADIREAHQSPGLLHRAFSVYVLIGNLILIQRRSGKKMLWPGIWANTCCSHPFENESPAQAGERRLEQELGFSVPLTPAGTFVYQAEDPFGNGAEHEHVTILRGEAAPTTQICPNPDEVQEWRWVDVRELQKEMEEHPENFAPWFHQGLAILLQ